MATVLRSISPPLMPVPKHEPYETLPDPLTIEIAFTGTDSFLKARSRSPSIPQSFTDDTDEENESDNKEAHEYKNTAVAENIIHAISNEDDEDDVFDRILFSFSREESMSRDCRRSVSSRRQHTNLRTSHNYTINNNKISLFPHIEDHKEVRARSGSIELLVPSPSASASCFNTLTKCNETGTTITLPMHRQKWIDDYSAAEYDTTPEPTNYHRKANNDKMKDMKVVTPPLSPIAAIKSDIEENIAINVETTMRVIYARNSERRRATIRPHGMSPSITGITANDANELETYAYIDTEEEEDDICDIVISDDDDFSPKQMKNVDLLQHELVLETTTRSLLVSCRDSKEVFHILRKLCISLKKEELLPYKLSFGDKILKYDDVKTFVKLLGFVANKKEEEWICDMKHRAETRVVDCAILECQKCLLLIHKHASINDLVHIHRMSCSKTSDHNNNNNDEIKFYPTLSSIESNPVKQEEERLYDDDYLQLYELIWSITHVNNVDHQAQDVLLLCYPLVTTAKKIMQCLEVRFFSDDDAEEGRETNFERILSSFTVQAKVIEFIRRWMQRYWYKDWENNVKLMNVCQLFVKRIQNAACDEKGLRLIEMLNKTRLNQKYKQETIIVNTDEIKKHKKKSSIIWRSNATKDANLSMMNVNAIIFAEQITLKFFQMFKDIHHRECLKQSWKHKEKKHILAPNITQYIDVFNELTKWIQTSILHASNLKQRSKIMKKWIKIEHEIYKLRNFQALCAIYSALASCAIYKLQDAWRNVRKSKKLKQYHETIKVIMRSTGNWKNLRRFELETHPPMIPYFGMFAQDLILIEETTNNRCNDGHINWNSLWRVNAVIDKYLIYQNTSYKNLSTNNAIQQWINKQLNMHSDEKINGEFIFKLSKHVINKDKTAANRLLFK